MRLPSLLSFAAAFTLGSAATMWAGHALHATPGGRNAYRALDVFGEVYGLIRREYVEAVDDQRLVRGALNGMAEALDPHTEVMDADAYARFQDDTDGEYAGIGLELDERDARVQVVSVYPDTPAARAGLRSGDWIATIDGEATRGWSLDDTVSRLRGQVGTRVVLTVERDAASGLRFELERARIHVEPVVSRLIAPDVALVSVRAFQDGTAAAFVDHLGRLRLAAGGALGGVVLDLRDNPGGLLDEAVAVADAMLADGEIVRTVGRDQKMLERFKAERPDVLAREPVVVLVNAGSASASEIVAGALQDRGRAVLVGTRTFGKGSVQDIFELGDGGALKLTVARYYTPSGRSIQAKGIEPDVVVPEADAPLSSVPTAGISAQKPLTPAVQPTYEADLEGALDRPMPQTAAPAPTPATGVIDTPPLDPVVRRGLEVLRLEAAFERGHRGGRR